MQLPPKLCAVALHHGTVVALTARSQASSASCQRYAPCRNSQGINYPTGSLNRTLLLLLLLLLLRLRLRLLLPLLLLL